MATLDLDAQFLLGPDLVVAPALAPHATSVAHYLPAGVWRAAFSGETTVLSAGKQLRTPAPLGKPAVYVRVDGATGAPRPSLEPFLREAAKSY